MSRRWRTIRSKAANPAPAEDMRPPAYISQFLTRHHLSPAAGAGGYFQSFSGSYRNLLGLLEGSDPALKQQVIVVGARLRPCRVRQFSQQLRTDRLHP